MASSFLLKTEGNASFSSRSGSVSDRHGSLAMFLTRLEEFAELNEEVNADVVDLQNAIEAADEVQEVVDVQEANVAAMEGEETVAAENETGEVIDVTPAEPTLSENSTPDEVTDVIVAEEQKVERIMQKLSRDKSRSKKEILSMYGINFTDIRTESVRNNALYVYKQKMEENKNFIARVWEAIKKFFKKIWEKITGLFKGKAMEAKAESLEEKAKELKEKAGTLKADDIAASLTGNGDVRFTPSAALTIATAPQLVNSLTSSGSSALGHVLAWARNIANSIGDFKRNPGRYIGNYFTDVLDIIGNDSAEKTSSSVKDNHKRLAIAHAIFRSTRGDALATAMGPYLTALANAIDALIPDANRDVVDKVSRDLDGKPGVGTALQGQMGLVPYAYNNTNIKYMLLPFMRPVSVDISSGDIRVRNITSRQIQAAIDAITGLSNTNIVAVYKQLSSQIEGALKEIDNKLGEMTKGDSEKGIIDDILGEISSKSEKANDAVAKQLANAVAKYTQSAVAGATTMLQDITNTVMQLEACVGALLKISVQHAMN